jgi:hypothetical protein
LGATIAVAFTEPAKSNSAALATVGRPTINPATTIEDVTSFIGPLPSILI